LWSLNTATGAVRPYPLLASRIADGGCDTSRTHVAKTLVVCELRPKGSLPKSFVDDRHSSHTVCHLNWNFFDFGDASWVLEKRRTRFFSDVEFGVWDASSVPYKKYVFELSPQITSRRCFHHGKMNIFDGVVIPQWWDTTPVLQASDFIARVYETKKGWSWAFAWSWARGITMWRILHISFLVFSLCSLHFTSTSCKSCGTLSVDNRASNSTSKTFWKRLCEKLCRMHFWLRDPLFIEQEIKSPNIMLLTYLRYLWWRQKSVGMGVLATPALRRTAWPFN